MLRLLAACSAAGLLVACKGSDATGPGNTVNVAGTWSYSENYSDQAHAISCSDAGTLVLNQTGSAFTGSFVETGTCSGPGGTADNSNSGTLSGGQVSGTSVSFQNPFCQYQGTLSGSPANQAKGTLSCTIQEGGQTFTFAGNWQAGR